MSAIRLARGSTRRDRILKFAGCYHGHADALLAEAGSGLATLGVPATAGVPAGRPPTRSSVPTTTSTPRRAARRALRRGARGVIVEPVAGNMGVVPPAPGFLEALRAALRRVRRAARLRRGDHRLPRRPRRRPGAVRRPAGPDDPRQDRRRRPAARGLRRPGRRDGAARAGGRRLPGGHALRKPARDRGGPRGAPRLRDAAVYEELERRGARLEAGLAPLGRFQRVGAMADALLREPFRTSRTRRRTRSATPRSSAICSSGASTSRRRSSRRCSSLSRTATRRSTGRGGRCRVLRRLTLDRDRARGRAEARSGARRSGRRRARRAGLLAARRGEVRARARDDLRGLSRALRPAAAVRAGDDDTALLLGDYLSRRASPDRRERVDEAVGDLAELISLCAQARAAGRRGRAGWAATAALIGEGAVTDSDSADDLHAAARAAGARPVDHALALHRRRVE